MNKDDTCSSTRRAGYEFEPRGTGTAPTLCVSVNEVGGRVTVLRSPPCGGGTDARSESMRARTARVRAGFKGERQRRAPASCWAAAGAGAFLRGPCVVSTRGKQNVGVNSTLGPKEKSATRLEFE
ncbi:hypothetical protein B0H10DRAFT_1954321 [Mycena sp. CBHHK59/15]|nr:hypothetical protein B0H10DRAFT_1954321 [Mycena sp. CBHHK59/15]